MKKIILCFLLLACSNLTPCAATEIQNSGPITLDTHKLSFNFQEVEVRKVLQYLASIQRRNIILSDSITGTLTLEIHELAWEEIFKLILKVKNLGQRHFDNVIYVAPLNEITIQQKQELLLEQQQADYMPVVSTLIPINYSKAIELAALLKEKGNSLLSSRGSVSVDSRTNTLWLEDHPQKIEEIRAFIKKLDVPVKQVLIEARIISVDTNYEEELGIRFKTLSTTPQTKSTAKHTLINNPIANLQMDLPAAVHLQAGAAAGVALAKLGKNILLDLELSAMESTHSGEIISNPKLITSDQQAALIQSGEEIPYQEATASGATNVTFKKALLSLQVTPQITPDNNILMNLKINQDKRGQTINGTPSIDTQQIETQVLAQNGDTIVLGGIYERSKLNGMQRVPFLSQIPVIGEMLSHRYQATARKELIIFITPTIIPYQNFVGVHSVDDPAPRGGSGCSIP